MNSTNQKSKLIKSRKPNPELHNTLAQMSTLLQTFSLGTTSKYIENISYLTNFTTLETQTEKFFLAQAISMVLLETLLDSGNLFPLISEHKIRIEKFHFSLSDLLRSPSEKNSKKLNKDLKSLIELNHKIVLTAFDSLSEPQKNKLKMLNKVHELCNTTDFNWNLLALQNIIERPVESPLFPVYTKAIQPFLPSQEKDLNTLVLDLDETLVHRRGQEVLVRPGAVEFLQEMGKVCEIVIFTAAVGFYADYAMKKIDPGNMVKLRLYRQHVSCDVNGAYKDIGRLGRVMSKMVIVDNLESNFRYQPENGICIKTWTGESDDVELGLLAEQLKARFRGE